MEEQPPHQIGKYTIRGQPGNGEFAHAYLAIDNQSDGDFDLSPSPGISSESKRHLPILESEEYVQNLCLPKEIDQKEVEQKEKELLSVFPKFSRLLEDLHYYPKETETAASIQFIYKYTHVDGKVDGKVQHRALIYIRTEILNKPGGVGVGSFEMISSAFDEGTTIIIFSKSSEYPDMDIYRIVKEKWPKENKKGEFVPWKYVEYLTSSYEQIKQIQKSGRQDTMMKALKKDVARILDGMLGNE